MFGTAGAQGQPGDSLQMQAGCQEKGAGRKGILQAVYFLAPGAGCGRWEGDISRRKENGPEILKTSSLTRWGLPGSLRKAYR